MFSQLKLTNSHISFRIYLFVEFSGGDAVCVDTGEPSCWDSESRLSEQLNGDSVSKLKGGGMVESGMIILHSEGNGSKLSKQEQQNDNSCTKESYVGSDIICHSSSEVPCKSNEKLKDEVETKSERSKDCIRVVGVHDTLGQESEFSKQSTCDAQSVQS
ncbi:unnamed protein product [Lupinus luteus]|uniref:Uncharacterized protein n=1 Tax=Lupinus luteus TaxID=3873 RepID=A0AAV1WDG8_LUPLU